MALNYEGLTISDHRSTGAEGDLAALNLPAIAAAIRDLQRAFPQINKELFDRRDPLDEDVLEHMLEGYARVDRFICEGVDIFAMGQLHHWLGLNAVVLFGADAAKAAEHRRSLEATESRFYSQPDGGIRDIMDWYALNRGKSIWRRTAGVYIRVLSSPQLFLEGNHRSGALIMSYMLAREGKPPFVLTAANAREFFNPSSVFKKNRKHSASMRLKLPGLKKAFGEYIERQANEPFLVTGETSDAATHS
jgi:hypothetical protein